MSFLAVLIRELRVAARRSLTYYSRFLAGLVAVSISLCVVYFGFAGLTSPVNAGRDLLQVLAVIGFVQALLAGVWFTSDSLSGEKREGTLGLLFLTDLNGFDIVLGKLVAQGLRPLYSLLACFPAPAVGFFLGGMVLGDYLWTMLILVNTLFFSLSLGLLISAVSRHERRAISGAFVALLLLTLVLPGVGVLIQATYQPGEPPLLGKLVMVCCWLASPLAPLIELVQRLEGKSWVAELTGASWLFFGGLHLLGWVMLLLAGWILPHAWQERGARAPFWGLARFITWLRREPAELPPARARRPQSHLADPAVWLAERRHPISQFFWGSLALLGLLFGALALYATNRRLGDVIWGMGVVTVVLLHWVLKIEVAIQACRALGEERRTGALELLLTTPLGEDEIVRGRMLALKRQFLAPVFLLLGIDFLLWLAVWTTKKSFSLELFGGTAMVIGGFVAMQLLDMYALAWLGLWLGLEKGNTNRALTEDLGRVLIRPWGLVLAIGALLAAVTQGEFFRNNQMAVQMSFFINLAAIVCGLTGACARGISHLQDDFRVTAAQIAAPEPSNKWSARLEAAAGALRRRFGKPGSAGERSGR